MTFRFPVRRIARTSSASCRRIVAGALIVFAPACAPRLPAGDGVAPGAATESGSRFQDDVPLRIENRFYGDVALTIERGGLRTRLATITGSTTRDLTIPKRHFDGVTPVRLIAEGIGAGSGAQRVSTTTGTLLVQPGQRIVWTLETQMERSSVGIY